MKQYEMTGSDCIKNAFAAFSNLEKYEVVEKSKDGFSVSLGMTGSDDFKLFVHTLPDAYPATILRVIRELRTEETEEDHVLLVPYISDRSADLCRKNGIGYFDCAGNCYFVGKSVYLSDRGNKNPNPVRQKNVSVFEKRSAVSSAILRTLLRQTGRKWKLKYLAKEVGCSIGQVSKVMNFLIRNVWASREPDGYSLSDAAGLIAAWGRVYAGEEQNAYSCYSLSEPAATEEKLRALRSDGVDYYLTGIAGGVRYAPVVRYNKIHVYIAPENIQRTLDALKLKQVSSGANVVIFPLKDEIYAADSRTINGDSVVSPVQIYLDCMRIKGRGEEMAIAVLKQEILK